MQMQLLHNKAALCASRSSVGCCTRLRSTAIARLRVACGAGKQAAGGGDLLSEQPHRQRNQKPRRSYLPRYDKEDNAPQSKGSELELVITCKIKASTSLPELEDVFNEWGGSFNFIHTSAAFTKAANLTGRRPAAQQLLDRLAATWDAVLPTSGPQGLANVLWACGKLGYTSSNLWSSTLAAFMQLHEEANCQDISNVVYALGLAAAATNGQVPGVSRAEVVEAVGQLTDQMRVFVTHPDLPGVAPQDISNALMGCAKLGMNPGDAQLCSLVQAMARPAMQELSDTQGLANTLHAASELQQKCGWQPALKEQVWRQLLGEAQLRKLADKGNPQHISNVILAVARLSSAAVFSKAFAQDSVVQLLHGTTAQQLGRWNEQDVANSMWACSKLGLFEQDFLQRAAAAAPRWLPNAAGRNITQVSWACGTLQFRLPQLQAAVLQRSQQLLQQGRGRGKQLSASESIGMPSMVGWAAAVLDMQQLAGGVRAVIASSGVKQRGTAIHPADAGRLWFIHSWLSQLLDGRGLAGLLTAEQLEMCQASAAAGPGCQSSEQ